MNNKRFSTILKNVKPAVWITIILIFLIVYASIDHQKREKEQEKENTIRQKQIEEQKEAELDSLENEQRKKEHERDSFLHTPAGIVQRKKEIRDSIIAQREEVADSIKEAKKYARVKKIMDKFNCSEDDARNLLNHKIWIGMTYDMVVYLRGRPNHVNVSNYGEGNEYQACWFDYTPSCFYFNESSIITSYN